MAVATPSNSQPEPPAFPSAVLDSPDVQRFLSEAAQEFVEDIGGAARGFLWAITHVGPGEVRNWASGSAKAREVDGVQNSFADGPALTAAASREFVHIPDAAVDRLWPGFSAAVVGQGVRSVLSVPILVEGELSAALTLCAAAPHAFSSEDVIHAVACARRLSRVCRLLLDLARNAGAAITQPPLSVTELAVWSLIRDYGLTKESAMQYLQAVVRDGTVTSPYPRTG
jgi:GAF domain-containing protein